MYINPNLINRQLDKANDRLVAREINAFEGEVLATGAEGDLYAGASHSCGYLFLKMTVIGTFQVSVLDDGMKVRFSAGSREETVDADQSMIETSFSRSMNQGITEFDILVEEELAVFIREKHPTTITVLIPVRQGCLWGKTEWVAHPFAVRDPQTLRNLIKPNDD